MECTISSESQKQGGSRNGSRAVAHATQRDEKAGIVPVDFQTAGRNFGRRREGVKTAQNPAKSHPNEPTLFFVIIMGLQVLWSMLNFFLKKILIMAYVTAMPA